MGDTQQLVQSIFIGLFFSFIIAKLISLAISHKDTTTNTTTTNNNTKTRVSNQPSIEPKSHEIDELPVKKSSSPAEIIDKKKREDCDSDDDDDWEGVEYTEMDEIFSAATAFVAASAADRLAQKKVSSENQLKLYGYYKIATEGICNTPQPSAINMSARAKWNAWHGLGSMSPEEAMEAYVELVCELYPSWAAGSASTKKDGDGDATTSNSKGMMGPVFSSLVFEEDSHNEAELEAIHESAREGEIHNLQKFIDSGVSVNLKDSEGRTPLHWAVDRGHTDIVELLLTKNADVDAKDNEGQTPLHYAAMCDREDIAELLVKQNADRDLKDNEGNSPSDLCETNSSWLQS